MELAYRPKLDYEKQLNGVLYDMTSKYDAYEYVKALFGTKPYLKTLYNTISERSVYNPNTNCYDHTLMFEDAKFSLNFVISRNCNDNKIFAYCHPKFSKDSNILWDDNFDPWSSGIKENTLTLKEKVLRFLKYLNTKKGWKVEDYGKNYKLKQMIKYVWLTEVINGK